MHGQSVNFAKYTKRLALLIPTGSMAVLVNLNRNRKRGDPSVSGPRQNLLLSQVFPPEPGLTPAATGLFLPGSPPSA